MVDEDEVLQVVETSGTDEGPTSTRVAGCSSGRSSSTYAFPYLAYVYSDFLGRSSFWFTPSPRHLWGGCLFLGSLAEGPKDIFCCRNGILNKIWFHRNHHQEIDDILLLFLALELREGKELIPRPPVK